jgi:hypothetical protein
MNSILQKNIEQLGNVNKRKPIWFIIGVFTNNEYLFGNNQCDIEWIEPMLYLELKSNLYL